MGTPIVGLKIHVDVDVESYGLSERKRRKTNMTTVIKINLLYSQTALIIAGSGVTTQNASKQHIPSKCHILSLKSNTWRLIIKSCNRNEPKQYTNTW